MVILEAQVCGVPCLVSDVGGPQEIVQAGVTGRVLPAQSLDAWVNATLKYVDMGTQDPAATDALRQRIRERFRSRCGWSSVLDEILRPELTVCEDPSAVLAPRPGEPRQVAALA
jgi:glycosyltransferase involved in cell wall biosynthesis